MLDGGHHGGATSEPAARHHEMNGHGPHGDRVQVATPSKELGLLKGLVVLARPKQWLKNVLVFAAPAAAGVLDQRHEFLLALGAFVAFCAAASGTYFGNDALDAEADRHHPDKARRPVASGAVPRVVAFAGAGVLMAVSLAVAWAVAGGRLAAVVAAYVVISVAYSVRLKHEPVLDLAGLSSGFILRAIAGGVACAVPLSDWFLIVTCFGSLFIAAGKRSSEHLHLGADRELHRPVLGIYSAIYLRSVRLMAAAVTMAAYCLWAFQRSAHAGPGHHPIWYELSIVPVVLALMYLELQFEAGRGGAPEDLAQRDRMLQVLCLVWMALFAAGVYG